MYHRFVSDEKMYFKVMRLFEKDTDWTGQHTSLMFNCISIVESVISGTYQCHIVVIQLLQGMQGHAGVCHSCLSRIDICPICRANKESILRIHFLVNGLCTGTKKLNFTISIITNHDEMQGENSG